MMWRVLTLVSLGIASGIVGVMVGDREPPTVIDATEVLTPEIKPGESLRVRFDVFRRRSCYVRVERMLLDGEEHLDRSAGICIFQLFQFHRML
jgi:hypothetical protein